jgi:hypothetical protein
MSQVVHAGGHEDSGESGVIIMPSITTGASIGTPLPSTQNPATHVRPVAHMLVEVQAKFWLRSVIKQLAIAIASRVESATTMTDFMGHLRVGARCRRHAA